jgi:hypothetical protein
VHSNVSSNLTVRITGGLEFVEAVLQGVFVVGP